MDTNDHFKQSIFICHKTFVEGIFKLIFYQSQLVGSKTFLHNILTSHLTHIVMMSGKVLETTQHSQTAKLLWPRSSPHPTLSTLSSGPHTTWNDGTWAVCSCFPDLGHKQTVCQPRTNQINQNWPTSRIHIPESTASLPEKAHI